MKKLFLERWGSALALASGLVLTAAAGEARQIKVQTANGQPDVPAQVEVKDGAFELSLDQAIELAMRHNLGLVIERYGQDQFHLGIESAKGIFDFQLGGDVVYSDSTSPNSSAIQGSTTVNTIRETANINVSQLVPTGGLLSFGFNNTRNETNGRDSIFSPSYTTGSGFTFVQPLLRGFGSLVTRQPILLARLDSRINRELVEERITLTLRDVSDAYWTLVETQEQLGVAQEGLALAKEIHERNRIQVEVGTMPPLDMVQSDANIATREEDIIRAQANVGDAEDRLRQLLNLPAGEIWERPIRTSTRPETETITVGMDGALASAFAERPELKRQQLTLERVGINRDVQRNLTRPRLDATVNYGAGGIGGTLIQRDAEGNVIRTFPGGYSDAIDQLLGLDANNWSVELNFGIPIQNRTARAQLAIANLEIKRAETIFEQLRQSVLTEVRTAVRRVDTAAKQIAAAQASLVFQERNLDAERKRYENGMSTAFQITQIQDQLTQAKSREVSAKIAYRTALTEYYRATGTLLEQEGVALEDPDFRESRESYFSRGR
jgi:outer membrane protein